MRALSFIILLWAYTGELCAQDGTTAVAPILPLNETSLLQHVDRAKGKVLLVNFWATWCVPCIEEFPDLLKVRATFFDQGLEVMFVSVDQRKAINKDVRAFLRKMNVRFATYFKDVTDDEVFINAIDPEWTGALPATFLYNKQGKLVQSLVDAQTYDEISGLVRSLLDE